MSEQPAKPPAAEDSSKQAPATKPESAATRAATPTASPTKSPRPGWMTRWFALRRPAGLIESVLLGLACIALVAAGWWLITLGPNEERWVGSTTLPSPRETFSELDDLWTTYALLRNTLVTLRRVGLGFLLAVVVGVPLGVLAGCFPRFNAFLMPVTLFGRNIPLAAVLPLLIYLFQGGEQRKVMFIFIACVAFVISDTARAIMDVAERYVDTAYTLGASKWQTIMKVLVPLAAPSIFASFRLLFGLAFGYIMLAESIKYADDVGGLGYQIQIFQRRGMREHIYLIILVIPVVALIVDRTLLWIEKKLFPHIHGGDGVLAYLLRWCLERWEDVKSLVFPGRRGNR